MSIYIYIQFFFCLFSSIIFKSSHEWIKNQIYTLQVYHFINFVCLLTSSVLGACSYEQSYRNKPVQCQVLIQPTKLNINWCLYIYIYIYSYLLCGVMYKISLHHSIFFFYKHFTILFINYFIHKLNFLPNAHQLFLTKNYIIIFHQSF